MFNSKTNFKVRTKVNSGKKLYLEVRRTNNNVVFKISHCNGIPLYQSTAGALGIQGSRRDSPTSAEMATRKVLKRLEPFSDRNITFTLIGPFDRVSRTIIKSVQGCNVNFSTFRLRNPTSHNGVRLRKPRRV